jgi:AcrR family transcriptional regulator
VTRRAPETRERILDAAEALFAKRGVDAAPLEEIAGQVGIRAPAIFRHFRNKEALYEAVVDRLMEGFLEATRAESIRRSPLGVMETVLDYVLDHPHLSQILQHAALADDERLAYIVKRWMRPFMEHLDAMMEAEGLLARRDDFSVRTIIMMFQVMMWGYVNLQHINAAAFGVDPLGADQREEVRQLLRHMATSLLREPEEPAR